MSQTASLVDALAAVPGRLHELFGQVEDSRAWRPSAEGEWSAAEVLLHMRASDAILAPRIPQILARPGVPLPSIDDALYGRLLGRAGLPIGEQVEVFAARRGELVALLRALSAEEWDLTGQHEQRGTISVRTIATHIAEHEGEHLAQIEAALRGPG